MATPTGAVGVRELPRPQFIGTASKFPVTSGGAEGGRQPSIPAAKSYPFKIGKRILGEIAALDGTATIELSDLHRDFAPLTLTFTLSQQIPQTVTLNTNFFMGFELPRDIPVTTPNEALKYLLTTSFDPGELLMLSGRQIRDMIKLAFDAINDAVSKRLKQIELEFIQIDGERGSGGRAGQNAPITRWEIDLGSERWNLQRALWEIQDKFGADVTKAERARILPFSVATEEFKALSR